MKSLVTLTLLILTTVSGVGQSKIEKLKKVMRVMPLVNYNDTYNESHTFISTTVFNNNIKTIRN